MSGIALRWFSPDRRRAARLAVVRQKLAAAMLALDDAADLLDDIRRDTAVKAMLPGANPSCEGRFCREAQLLAVAAAEVRGISLPDLVNL